MGRGSAVPAIALAPRISRSACSCSGCLGSGICRISGLQTQTRRSALGCGVQVYRAGEGVRVLASGLRVEGLSDEIIDLVTDLLYVNVVRTILPNSSSAAYSVIA